MCAGNFDATRSEGLVDKIIGNDRDLTVTQGQVNHLADQMLVADIFRVHAQGAIGQHGFRACGGNGHAGNDFCRAVFVGNGFRTVHEGVADVPEVAISFNGLNLQVRDGSQ